uniref:Uncharacterized protein n=1 Tax=Arundo donax TaxID=35708 RepID=A0A0A9EBI8_ARUDO
MTLQPHKMLLLSVIPGYFRAWKLKISLLWFHYCITKAKRGPAVLPVSCGGLWALLGRCGPGLPTIPDVQFLTKKQFPMCKRKSDFGGKSPPREPSRPATCLPLAPIPPPQPPLLP